jgi:formate C-acetyltransferase
MPLDAVFMDGCIESLTGVYNGGARYQNYGSHGVGIANAADALAAVRQLIFEEKSVTPAELLTALDADFEGYEALRERLLSCPKMGNNDDRADLLASRLMEAFSKALAGRPNDRGGVWRAGTGSAQAYVFQGKKTPATADGRKAGDPFPSSFSPALEVKTDGLLSTFASFTKYDLSRIINGGPLTVEVHDSVFRNETGILKTAELVRKFIELGGHELQINSVNREVLLDAQKHPENYPNLIVRVWGWSGYFVELAPDFQNQIIRRLEYRY